MSVHRLVAAASVAAACSTTYQPRRDPAVQVVMRHGMPVFVRDGREYPHGFGGGGLVEAVAANPRALEHARTYRTRMIAGFVLVLGAPIFLGAGAAATAGDDGGSAVLPVSVAVAIGAIVAGYAALISAPPHAQDAINIYNDDVRERVRAASESDVWSAPPGAPPAPPAEGAPSRRE